MATLSPPKRNHSNAKQYGTGFSPSTMFGSTERADLMSIERPRRKRVSSIEMMMRALRLEEEQLDINSDESFDSPTTDNKENVGNRRDIKHAPTIRRSKSNEDTPDVRRLLTESLATAKTIRMNNRSKIPKARAKSLEPMHLSISAKGEESVHEAIMASIINDKGAISDEESEGSAVYHDSRDSLHEVTMEIIRNEHAERSKVQHSNIRRTLSGLKVPSAVFESSKFIEEDGLMVLKTRSTRKNHRHADNSSSNDWRRRSFNASSA